MRAAAGFLCAALAAAQTPVLWRDPGDISKFDFAGAAGAPPQPPKPPFTFVREDSSGTQPKLFARDAAGVSWNVKFGREVKNESFCWRIVHACGYFTESSFLVPQGEFQNYRPLKRKDQSLTPDGHFTNARFQYRDPAYRFLARRNWRWDRPPFAGAKELSGLKILIMLFSNWDNKDGRAGPGGPNTAIFEHAGEWIYAFTDWGSGMGRWGSGVAQQTNWRCEDFAAQTPEFVKSVDRGQVMFGWEGDINDGFKTGIPVDHIAWFLDYLGRITDAQFRAALKAAGATGTEADCFTPALRGRIEQLRTLAKPQP